MVRIPTKLRRLIDDFRLIHPELSAPSSAKGMCTAMSAEFRGFTIGNGFEDVTTWDIVLDDAHDRHLCPEWYPNIASEGHTVAYAGGVVVDWTIRQYNEKAPFPLVYRPRRTRSLVPASNIR